MNPLLEPWTTPFGLPPFDAISDADFGPAVDATLAEARSAVRAIGDSPEPASFQNTIVALELADRDLSRVLSAFWSVTGADSNDARQALERELAPKLSAYGSEITSNKALFARIDDLWQRRAALGLSPEEARVLDLTHRSFVRAGARLEGDDAERMKEIKSRLATLGTQFAQNVLADERGWSMALADADMEGLPDFVVAAAQSAGEAAGAGGPVVTLSRSLIVPFLQFSPRRDLRRKAFEAWTARGANGGATDNRSIAAEMLRLREERARLLGFQSFRRLEARDRDGPQPAAVKDLLMEVWQPAREAALRDAEVLERMLGPTGIRAARALGLALLRREAPRGRARPRRGEPQALLPARPHDRGRLRRSLAPVPAGVREVDGPRYHPDVRLWEVTRDGAHVALFIGDFFARPSKRSGAWCSAMRSQSRLGGDVRPLVINVCNFRQGGRGAYAAVLGRRADAVPRVRPCAAPDAVGRDLRVDLGHVGRPRLRRAARRNSTSTGWRCPRCCATSLSMPRRASPCPRRCGTGCCRASTFDMGFQTVEYVASALVDLAVPRRPRPRRPDAAAGRGAGEIGMPHAIRMRHATPHFAHVFSGDGYSAGYYSYMWSEVMDADAFAAFQERGDPFDPELARSLERNVLSVGGSREEGESYLAFRGRMPGVEALLKGRGLLPEAA
jgi:peptidyl-dipeptidase Dcp